MDAPQPWQRALQTILSRTGGLDVPWVLAGSAGAVLQGVNIEPHDLDLPFRSPDGVYALLGRLTDHLPPRAARNEQDWRSSAQQPVRRFEHRGGRWTYARLDVEGCEVEVAHIDQPGEENLLAEIHGEPIWSALRVTRWRGHEVPVVPLELSLVSNVMRGRHERAARVAEVLVSRGYDDALLERACADRAVPLGQVREALGRT